MYGGAGAARGLSRDNPFTASSSKNSNGVFTESSYTACTHYRSDITASVPRSVYKASSEVSSCDLGSLARHRTRQVPAGCLLLKSSGGGSGAVAGQPLHAPCIVGKCVCVKHKSQNKGLISVDRSNKATLLLTIPRSLFKSSAKDLSPPIFEIVIR